MYRQLHWWLPITYKSLQTPEIKWTIFQICFDPIDCPNYFKPQIVVNRKIKKGSPTKDVGAAHLHLLVRQTVLKAGCLNQPFSTSQSSSRHFEQIKPTK